MCNPEKVCAEACVRKKCESTTSVCLILTSYWKSFCWLVAPLAPQVTSDVFSWSWESCCKSISALLELFLLCRLLRRSLRRLCLLPSVLLDSIWTNDALSTKIQSLLTLHSHGLQIKTTPYSSISLLGLTSFAIPDDTTVSCSSILKVSETKSTL